MEETNSNPNVVPPMTSMPAPGSKPSKAKWWGLGVLVVVLIAVAAGAFVLKQRNNPETSSTAGDQVKTPNHDEPLVSGLIAWNYPVSANLSLLKPQPDNPYPLVAQYYKVGTFNSGKYQNAELDVASIPCDCPAPNTVLRLVNFNTTEKPYVVLKKNSDPLDNVSDTIDSAAFTVDADTDISDLNPPQTLTGFQNQTLTLSDYPPFQQRYTIFNPMNLRLVYKDPKVGAVYTSPDNLTQVSDIYSLNGFYVKSPDYGVWVYSFTPSFVGQDNIPQINWNKDGKNIADYSYIDSGGCGGSDYFSVATAYPNDVKLSDLMVTGKAANGDNIYEFTDPNAQELKDMYANDYNPYNSTTYENDPNLKIPYIQFTSSHPIFFWTDPFGRLIQFKNKEFFVSAAECGKPVIYLYPTRTEKVSIKLNPTGGFTYTEPDYANGWNVLATPSGELTNLSDGKNYPYLFWEGRSNDIYQIPDKGFVVKQTDLHNFLNQKLALLGLNAKETADFEAYWEPYMKTSPYYFVTFMGNDVMNKIAPLEVSPKPDTVIRILMDFKPLDKPIQVQGYDIKTPARNGFTVVEWGGVKP